MILLGPMFPMAVNYASYCMSSPDGFLRFLTDSIGWTRISRCVQFSWQRAQAASVYDRRDNFEEGRSKFTASMSFFILNSLRIFHKRNGNQSYLHIRFHLRLVAMMGIMIVLWALFPLTPRRAD